MGVDNQRVEVDDHLGVVVASEDPAVGVPNGVNAPYDSTHTKVEVVSAVSV